MRRESYEGKLCIVLGEATSEMVSIVESFAKDGCVIAIMDSEKKVGTEVGEALRTKYGAELFYFNGNRDSEEDIEFFTHGLIGIYGKIQYIINYASTFPCEGRSKCFYDHMDQAMKNSVTLPLMVAKAVKDDLAEDAVLVNITNDFTGEASCKAEHCPIRCGIDMILDSILYMTDNKIRAVGLSVGMEMKENDSMGRPLDLVQTVRLLCDKKCDFLNGTIIPFDGTLTSAVLYSKDNGWELKKDE